jgi:hypothetical protein
MSVRAKFMCHYVQPTNDGVIAHMHAVYSTDPNNPNHSWSKATPGASLQMTISNPDAVAAFEQGKEYFLDFTPAG